MFMMQCLSKNACMDAWWHPLCFQLAPAISPSVRHLPCGRGTRLQSDPNLARGAPSKGVSQAASLHSGEEGAGGSKVPGSARSAPARVCKAAASLTFTDTACAMPPPRATMGLNCDNRVPHLVPEWSTTRCTAPGAASDRRCRRPSRLVHGKVACAGVQALANGKWLLQGCWINYQHPVYAFSHLDIWPNGRATD